jgi:hypothetical protein
MADLVRVLESVCNANDIRFHYGNKSHLNLIDANSDLEPDKIHLLLFPLRRGNLAGNTRLYNGNFFYVMPDDFAQEYHNETGGDNFEAKYTSRIEPLIKSLDALEQKLKWCEGLDIVSFESVDAIDVLDANMSGLFVTFQFRLYE